jgi:hypothetical protein
VVGENRKLAKFKGKIKTAIMSETYLVLKLKTKEQLQSSAEEPSQENPKVIPHRQWIEKLWDDLMVRTPFNQAEDLPEMDFKALYPAIMTSEIIDRLRRKSATLDQPQQKPADGKQATDDEIIAVGPNVVPAKKERRFATPESIEKRRREREERNLDHGACFLYQNHYRRQHAKSNPPAGIERVREATKAAREKWATLSPADKAFYLDMAKGDREQRQARKDLFNTRPLP